MNYKAILKLEGPFSPNDHTSRYDHFVGQSPLGQVIIEWKGWKDQDARLITVGDSVLDTYPLTDQEAFEALYQYFQAKKAEIEEYLKLT